MLVLTRRVGESLTIGEDVSVTVLAARGSQIRLGINAPAHVIIQRNDMQSGEGAMARDAGAMSPHRPRLVALPERAAPVPLPALDGQRALPAAGSLPRLGSDALRHFDRLCPGITEAVLRYFRTLAGPSGAPADESVLTAELGEHLAAVRVALEFGALSPLVAHLRWNAGYGAARELSQSRAALVLDRLGETLGTRTAGEAGAAAAHVLRAARLQANVPAPADAAEAPVAADECELIEDYLRAVLDGDRVRAEALVARQREAGRSQLDVNMTMVQPALRELGRRWYLNQISVAQEHLATSMIHGVMMRFQPAAPAALADARSVLLACVAGNQHVLGMQMLADALRIDGWAVQSLGGNVPTEALLAHVEAQRPTLLGLSVSLPAQLSTVAQIMAGLTERLGARRPAVILGGRAIQTNEALMPALGVDGWAVDARSAVREITRLAAAG